MRCPVCNHSLTKAQELLYRIEEVYYCPHCWIRIAGRETVERKAKEKAQNPRTPEPAMR
jgi:hypothetical protein